MLRLTAQLVLVTRVTDNSRPVPNHLIHLVLNPGQIIQAKLDKEEGATMEAHNLMMPLGRTIKVELDIKKEPTMEHHSNLDTTVHTPGSTQKIVLTPMIPATPSILGLLQTVVKRRSHGNMTAMLSQPYQATEPSSYKATVPSLH